MEYLLEKLVVGPIAVNCYILADKGTKEAAVIDPGDEADAILLTMAKMKVRAKYVLLTHAHVDHVAALKSIVQTMGAQLLMHKADSLMLKTAPAQALAFGLKISIPPKADRYVDDGDEIELGAMKIKVLHTPGHSGGCVCYAVDGMLFVGDTLFAGSIGRTDLPGGSYEDLIEGVRTKLFAYDDKTMVYPGHGPETTIGNEKKYNPFFA